MDCKKTLLISLVALLLVGCQLLGSDAGDPTAVPVTTVPIDSGTTSYPAPGSDPAIPPATATPTIVQAVVALPEAFPIAPPSSGTLQPGTTARHTVSQGEWLLQIARCYGTSYTALRQANPTLANPNMITPGSTLIVPNVGSTGAASGAPCVQRHTVQVGETWASLAQQYGTDAATLQRVNPGALAVGRAVYLPTLGHAGQTMPTLSHDLLFLHNGRLVRYDAAAARADKFEDSNVVIYDIVLSENGRWLLAEQSRDNNVTTEIALYDLETATVTILETGLSPSLSGSGLGSPLMPGRDNMLLSPDGQWGAYVRPDGDSSRLTTFPTSNPATLKHMGIQHGVADGLLPELFPGRDAAHFLWLDNSGILELDYALNEGERRLYQTDAASPGGSDAPINFDALAWSPQGRYLLLLGMMFEGASYYLFDSETGGAVALPKATVYVLSAAASWQPDGTAVVLSPLSNEGGDPTRAVYRPTSGDAGLAVELVGETAVSLPPGDQSDIHILMPPVQPSGDSTLFAFFTSLPSANNGIWTLPAAGSEPTQRVALPGVNEINGRLLWAPDAASSIVDRSGYIDGTANIHYVPFASDAAPFAFSDWLPGAYDFNWVK